ncbi:hypothetical protein GIY30_20840 [Gordonia sp. HNM0687]|uniref:Uncharacterized protein n=1 Tax=Gordonia mangrovi TaxID=2665643 RepID=A0A6L7GUZ2_9ACTN|nr:hypothetical protein [Gordonia mangrovi]MXP23789.1 hypothetical protein [Gordonia mangrovi]UVF79839.1 hypothetical protein NWF22_08460 [Gordonia mangrovi]
MPMRHGRFTRRAVIGHPVVRSPAPIDSASLVAKGVARRKARDGHGATDRSD